MKKMMMMMKYRFYLAVMILVVNEQTHAQETTKVNDFYTIPFELTDHNNLSIKAVLNDTDTVNLMFHTAAGSITLTNEASSKLTSIHWDTEEEVNSWGGEATARYSGNNALEISGLNWDSIAIWENEKSGPTTDGKFGPNLFAGKVIEINFDESVIVIHETLPKKMEGFVKVSLIFEDEFMFIEGTSKIEGVSYQNRFLIHSGYGGTILFDDKFVAESKIGEQIEIIDEKELKDSYGNVLKTKRGILPEFTLGAEVFEDMPVGFFEGTIGRQQMSVMGGDLLKRFNILIDANREYIYLRPNQLRKSAYAGM